MAKRTKTDNHHPHAKLELRRHFLRRYADEPLRVMDCCQGTGRLWDTLREEFQVASYWGLDLKPKKGRLKIDSARVLAQRGWPQNVVDVDTYGSPWRHWLALLPNVVRPVTVFLTIGRVSYGGGSGASGEELRAVGAVFRRLTLPLSFGLIARLSAGYLLAKAHQWTRIIEAVEAVSTGNARYLGLRLEPHDRQLPEVPATA